MSEHSEPLVARPTPALLRWIARAWAALRFRDVFLATILPIMAVVLLFGTATYDYARTRHFDDWWANAQSVTGFFTARTSMLSTLPATLALRHQFEPDGGETGILRLTVEGRDWDQLQSDPLAMWDEWVDARLEYGGMSIDARIKKRGDNSIHWMTDKRTLTVRTPRDDFYKRYRSFGLSIKTVVPSYLANRMATEFGVLAPSTEVVAVYLNNRFFGTYRFIELADESFLRPYERMPGNIFRADRAERGEAFKGVPRGVFQNPTLWDRTARNDRWTSAGPGQLRLLLDDVNGGTFEDHQSLLRRVDAQDFARLFAYLFMMGDPYHMDRVHNQLLYEDPSTQRLHPIPWDIRLLDLRDPPQPVNELFIAMLRDPFVIDQMVREIGRRVADDAFLRTADSLLRDVEQRFGPYLEYDRRRAGLVPDVGRPEDAMRILRGNVDVLRTWMRDDTVAVHASRAGSQLVLDFETRGRVGADLTALEFDGGMPATLRVRLDRNRNGVLDAADPVVRTSLVNAAGASRLTMLDSVPLLASWTAEEAGIVPGHVAYRVFVEGAAGDALPAPVLVNRVTGDAANHVAWEAAALVRPPTGWHPWQYPVERGRAIRFAGTVRLDSTLRVGRLDTLIVEPGTTMLLAPDVSIVSRGLVIAEGTEARPIRFLPQIPGRPWGAFSLQDHGTDNSVVRWAEFVQGGGALVDRIEYIGMINVHLAVNVVFDRVTFRENLRSDDTFHALHAQVDLTNSTFIDANSDAVDYDVATGEIRGNTFDNTGGDAVDLMASTPRIIGNIIRGSRDKGISIGEASTPIVFDNYIEGCTIGIEVKDRSQPIILNNEVVGNRTGLRERRKNWRYGGGAWATIINTRFRDNRTLRSRDTLSRLTAHGVVGLGDSVPAGPETDLSWLYRAIGFEPTSTEPGRAQGWKRIPVVPAIQEFRFVDDFGPQRDGWEPQGSVTLLEKRRDALRLHVEGRHGSALRQVDWSLEQGGTAVLEIAGQDLAAARVIVYSATDSIVRPLSLTTGLLGFNLVVMPLPPGRYTGVRIEATPRDGLSRTPSPEGLFVVRAGRLELRSLAVYPPDPRKPTLAVSQVAQ